MYLCCCTPPFWWLWSLQFSIMKIIYFQFYFVWNYNCFHCIWIPIAFYLSHVKRLDLIFMLCRNFIWDYNCFQCLGILIPYYMAHVIEQSLIFALCRNFLIALHQHELLSMKCRRAVLLLIIPPNTYYHEARRSVESAFLFWIDRWTRYQSCASVNFCGSVNFIKHLIVLILFTLYYIKRDIGLREFC